MNARANFEVLLSVWTSAAPVNKGHRDSDFESNDFVCNFVYSATLLMGAFILLVYYEDNISKSALFFVNHYFCDIFVRHVR